MVNAEVPMGANALAASQAANPTADEVSYGAASAAAGYAPAFGNHYDSGVPQAGTLDDLPPFPLPSPLNEKLFQGTLQNAYPLSPDEIRQFRDYLQNERKALAPLHPPKARSRLVQVDATPGMEPVAVELSAGYVSALVMIDGTGYAWPVTSVVCGDRDSISAVISKSGSHNLITVTPLRHYGGSNLVVTLDGLDQPLTVLLHDDDRVVDYRVMVRVVGARSPRAPAAIADNNAEIGLADDTLRGVAQDLPPAGSHPVKLSGGRGEAWLGHGTLYLRTPWTLIWPSWKDGAHIALAGVQAYELPDVPDILMIDEAGATHQVKLDSAAGD